MYKSIIFVAITVAFAEVNADLAGFNPIAPRNEPASESQAAAHSSNGIPPNAPGFPHRVRQIEPQTDPSSATSKTSSKPDAEDDLAEASDPTALGSDPSSEDDESLTTPTDSASDPKTSPLTKAGGDSSTGLGLTKAGKDSSKSGKEGDGSATKSTHISAGSKLSPTSNSAGGSASGAKPDSFNPIARRDDTDPEALPSSPHKGKRDAPPPVGTEGPPGPPPHGKREVPSTVGTEGGGPAPTPNTSETTPDSTAAGNSDPFDQGNDPKSDSKEPYSAGQPPASVPGDVSSGKCMCPVAPTCGAAPPPPPPPPAPETFPNGTASDSTSQPAPSTGGADPAKDDDSDQDNAAGNLATPEATVVTGLVATAFALFAL